MKYTSLLFGLLILMSLVIIGGCASKQSGGSFSRSEARKVQQVEFGVVEFVRPVEIEGTKTPIGAGAGAAVGSIAGSTVGSRKDGRIGAVLGGVAGGLIGAAAEEQLTKKQGVEVTVRLENGEVIAIVQEAVPEETFDVGDRVRVLTVEGNSRVTH